jgi:hypothetical protein
VARKTKFQFQPNVDKSENLTVKLEMQLFSASLPTEDFIFISMSRIENLQNKSELLNNLGSRNMRFYNLQHFMQKQENSCH